MAKRWQQAEADGVVGYYTNPTPEALHQHHEDYCYCCYYCHSYSRASLYTATPTSTCEARDEAMVQGLSEDEIGL